MTRRIPRRRLHLGAATLAAAALAAGALSAQPVAASSPDIDDLLSQVRHAGLFSPQLVRVDTPNAASRSLLGSLGLDLAESAGRDFTDVVVSSEAEKALLRSAGLTWKVAIADLARREARNAEADRRYAARKAASGLPSGRTSYRTLADYNREMAAMAKNRPNLVKSIKLKRPSLDGRAIYGIEIGRNVRRANSGQPTFFIMGAHHAREWPSAENTMEFAVDLVKNYGKNARITDLLSRGRVLVVPVVNADGFDMSRTSGDQLDLNFLNAYDPTGLASILVSIQAYKRKNCRIIDGVDTPDGTCALSLASPGGFGAGVDLNRNYGGLWGGPGAAAQTPNPLTAELGPFDPTYRGAAPFSEPESQNVRDLVAERQVTMLITNHTFGDLILRPNGVNPKTIGHNGKPVGDSPDEAGLKKLGAAMSAQNGYANQHGWELYDTTGTTEDWSYNATGGYGYTFEIGGNEFHPPFQQVVGQYLGTGKYAGKGNREAYLIAFEHAVDTEFSGVLQGRAPKGAVLRLSKTYAMPTWESTYRELLSSSMTVPASGTFSWIVNPSTRPITLATNPKAKETYTLTCSVGGTVRQTSKVYVERGQTLSLDLSRCGAKKG
ncbi:M14 family zinc carboxypeptidase [Nocardioides sp. R-C-SC26]|uniref:M14 family zinc carboxypeptidase n=1 Tax=Nocardioides sp. R-C-SC26 TaxID=2870414 RepID=UPI001E516603|nr:M14 family zinc carboxypeptidase [Nocardioides sp. R-C-SC26]